MEIKPDSKIQEVILNRIQEQKVQESKNQKTNRAIEEKSKDQEIENKNNNKFAAIVELQHQKIVSSVKDDGLTQQAREEKINQIKEQIKRGEFKVDANMIADKMIKNIDTMSVLLKSN